MAGSENTGKNSPHLIIKCPGEIIARKKGYNPNSSSVGSDVPTLLFFMFFSGSLASIGAVLWPKIKKFLSRSRKKPPGKEQE